MIKSLFAAILGFAVCLCPAQTLLPAQWLYNSLANVSVVSFSPDGTLVAAGGSGGLQVFSRISLGLTAPLPTTMTSVNGIQFSPDGTRLVIVGSSPVATQIVVEGWNVANGKLEVQFLTDLPNNTLSAVAISPDAKTLALAGSGLTPHLETWDIGAQTLIASLKTAATQVNALAFSADSSMLADGATTYTPSSTQQKGIVELWSSATGAPIQTLATASGIAGVTAVGFSADGSFVVDSLETSSSGKVSTNAIQIWSLASSSIRRTLTSSSNQLLSGVAFTPDDSTVVDSGGNYSAATQLSTAVIEIWNAATGAAIGSVSGPAGLSAITRLAVSPDSSTIAAGGFQNSATGSLVWTELDLFDVATLALSTNWALQSFQQPGSATSGVSPIAFSSDSMTLASGGFSFNSSQGFSVGSIVLRNAQTGVAVGSIPTAAQSGVNSLAYAPVGGIFADGGITSLGGSGYSGVVELWNTASGSLIAKPMTRASIVNGICFSPDGQLLAAGGVSYGTATTAPTLEVWNSLSGAVRLELESLVTAGVQAVAFSPDGATLADAGMVSATGNSPVSGLVELWDVGTGTQSATLRSAATLSLATVGFSPNGSLIADGGSSEGGQPVLELWNAKTFQLVMKLPLAAGTTVVQTVAFSPDSTLLFAGTDVGLQVFDATTYVRIAEYGIFSNPLSSSQFQGFGSTTISPDGSLLAGAAESNSPVAWLGVVPNPYYASSPPITKLTITPSSVLGGTQATGTLSISAVAPKGGINVPLSSSDPNAIVPPSALVPAGSATTTFPVTTLPTQASTELTITAGSGSNNKSAGLVIEAATLTTVVLNPGAVQGGSTESCTITLNGPAGPLGAAVSIYSSSQIVETPNTVTIPAGQTTASFSIETTPVKKSTSVTITCLLLGSSGKASFSVLPNTLSTIGVSSASIPGGNLGVGTVTLTGPAPTGGITVTLSTSNLVAKVPASVTVLSGQSSARFNVTTTAVAKTVAATLTAQSGSVQAACNVEITPATLSSLTVNSLGITGGGMAVGTVTLDGIAGPGGVVIKLASGSKLVTVPSSVEVPSGKSSAIFAVHTVPVAAPTSVTISASIGTVVESAVLTIYPPTIVSMSVTPSVMIGGGVATGKVTLGGPSPAGGIRVVVVASPASVIVPASVVVPAGASSASFPVKTSPVGVQTLSMVTAAAGSNSQVADLTINPPTLSSFSLTPQTLKGGKSATGTVTISSPAPAGGLVVSIACSNHAATAPATVTIASGRTSVKFTVSTGSVTSTQKSVITAALLGLSKVQTLTITH